MAKSEETAKTPGSDQTASPWVAALNKLREWDPVWAGQAVKMTMNPWADGILPTKFIELVLIGLTASRTQPKSGRDAPPYPGGHRGRREPPGDLIRSQVRLRHVHSLRHL